MPQGIFAGFDLRAHHPNVQRFVLFAVLYFSGYALFSLLYNLYLLRLGYQEDFIGWLAGLTPLASGLCAVPVGYYSDRLGRKPFLVGSVLLMAAAQLGLCLAADPWLLKAFAVIGGLSLGFVYVNHVPFLAEFTAPENRRQVIAIGFSTQIITRTGLSLAGGFLPGLMGRLGGFTLDQPEPYRWALLLGCGLTIASIGPLLGLQSPSPPREKNPAQGGGLWTDGAWKILLVFMGISAFRGLSNGITSPFFNVFFEEVLLASTATIGLIFFWSQGVGLPGVLIAPSLARRFGAVPTITLLRVAGMLCLGLLGGLDGLLLGAFIFLLFWAVENTATPVEMAFANEQIPPHYWARMQSVRVLGFQLPSAMGSFWAGEMIVHSGYGPVFGVGALALLASCAILVLRYRRG